jgi:hypothetical protein
MRRAIARGTARDMAISLAVKAQVTYQAIADELGLTRQRVQQSFPGGAIEEGRVPRPQAQDGPAMRVFLPGAGHARDIGAKGFREIFAPARL